MFVVHVKFDYFGCTRIQAPARHVDNFRALRGLSLDYLDEVGRNQVVIIETSGDYPVSLSRSDYGWKGFSELSINSTNGRSGKHPAKIRV